MKTKYAAPMEHQKTLAKAMKAAGLVWATAGFAKCDDLACKLCKKPIGSKDPGWESKPKSNPYLTSFIGDRIS